MDTLRNVGDSLPKPAAHTSGIPSGLFVFGGAAGSVQQSNADDSRALDELSSMGPEFDGMARAQPRQARRMSASKASSRRRRSSSSSLSGTQPRLPTPALFVPGDGGNVNSGGGGSGNAGELTNPVFGHNQSRGIEAEDSGFGGGSSSSGSGSGTHGNPSAAAAVAVAAEEEGKSCGDDGGGEGVQERGGGEGGGGTGVKPSKGRSSWSGMDRKVSIGPLTRGGPSAATEKTSALKTRQQGVKSGGGAKAALPVMSAEREEELIRLVQAEQLGDILDRIQSEQRDVEELRTRHARAWDEWKFFAEAVEATAAELLELEALGRTVQEDYAGDAGLSTEVSRAQAGLEDLQRSVMESMDKFTKQLDQQAASLRRVDDAFSAAGDQATVDAYEEVERKLAEALSKLGLFYTLAENDVAGLETGVDVLIARDLEELLRDKAAETYRNAATDTPPPQSSSKRKEENVSPHELIGRIARAEIDRVRLDKEQLVKKRNDSRRERGGDGGQECISEERLMEEVEEALENHAADGTGLRDFANKAIGGKVINSNALTSATFTPNGWLFPSTFMHKAGIENGIGPVDSVISEDSSLGRCWVMKGSVGRVTIRLPMEITVDGVSLEHASRMVTHESTSAPRDFEVYGLTNTDGRDPVRLTKGSYDLEGAPIQTFSVISSSTTPFSIIQFEFLSNWGHPDYTCIYRVRVHGRETA